MNTKLPRNRSRGKVQSRQGRDKDKSTPCGLAIWRKPAQAVIVTIFLIFIVLSSGLYSQPTGGELLKRVDAIMTSNTKIIISKMIIHGRRRSRTIVAKSYIQGTDKSFSEYLAPAREKGTKMLKLGDQLWTYSPQTDRTIRISGHMLRQSLMGSDLSYEDMMEDPRLENHYKAKIIGEESVLDRPCWVVQLDAKKIDVAYHSRKIWVDKERYLVLRGERYAKSGKLLKTTSVDKIERMSGRWVVASATFKDQLRNGKGTQFIVESVQFNAAIPAYIFSKAALKK